MPETGKKKAKRKKGGWAAFILILLLVILVLVGGAAAFYFTIVFDLPRLTNLKDYSPYIVSEVYSEDEALIGEFFIERRTVVPLSQMPRFLSRAFIAAEDARFFEHRGIDYWRILRGRLPQYRGPGCRSGRVHDHPADRQVLLPHPGAELPPESKGSDPGPAHRALPDQE